VAGPEGEERAEALVEGVQRRLRYSSIAANATGGAVVFVLVGFVFPRPPEVNHKYWLLGLNAGHLQRHLGQGRLPKLGEFLRRCDVGADEDGLGGDHEVQQRFRVIGDRR